MPAGQTARPAQKQGVSLAPRPRRQRTSGTGVAGRRGGGAAVSTREEPGLTKTAVHAGEAARRARSQGVPLAPCPQQQRPTARRTAAVAVRAAAVEPLPRNLAALPLIPAEQPRREKTGACAEENARGSAAQGVSLAPRPRPARCPARETVAVAARAAAAKAPPRDALEAALVPAREKPGARKTVASAWRAARAAAAQGVTLAPRPRQARPTEREPAAAAAPASAEEEPGPGKAMASTGRAARAAAAQGVTLAPCPRQARPTTRELAAAAAGAALPAPA